MSTMFKQHSPVLFSQTRKQIKAIPSLKVSPEIKKHSVLSFHNIAYVDVTVPLNWSHDVCTTSQVGLLHPLLMLLSYRPPLVSPICDERDNSSDSIKCKDSVYGKDNLSPKLDNSWNVGNNSCEYCHGDSQNCELAYESDMDSESDEDDWSDEEGSVYEDSDDDPVVEFTNELSPVQQDTSLSANRSQGMCPIQSLCVPVLNHTSSFSSEESGFCDQNQSDWSDGETDCEECPFDEGLWHMLQDQACFNFLDCTNVKKQVSKTDSKPLSSVTITPSSVTKKPSSVTMDINDTTLSDVTPKINNIHDSTVTTSCDGTLRCENIQCCSPPNLTRDTSALSSNSLKHVQKRVTFKPECELVEVHRIIAWNRKGPWEQFAIDRDRFWKRIESVEKIIGPCLKRKLSTCTGLK